MSKPIPIIAALDALREKDGRTVYQLALDADLDRQTVANLLHAKTAAKSVAAVAAMGVALGYRLTWEPIPKKERS